MNYKYSKLYLRPLESSSAYSEFPYDGKYVLDKDKLIISNNGKNYSVKIYSLDEMLKEAKEYLK